MRKQWPVLFFWARKSLQMDCSHEIKRHLLLGRKVMTNLDSILKSRDITLSAKVHLVTAVVALYGCENWTFPVSMYGSESWTIKRLSTEELMLLNCDIGKDSRFPWTARRCNQSILREISLECSLEGLIFFLIYFN